jgi:cell division protein ZipA
MGLREWLIILGGVVLLLIIADGIRRMRKDKSQEPEALDLEELDPEEQARREQIRRELPNGGARVIKTHTAETFNDPVPVLCREVDAPMPEASEQEHSDIGDHLGTGQHFDMDQDDYASEDRFTKSDAIAPDGQSRSDVYTEADTAESSEHDSSLDNTDSSYFDAFCQPDYPEDELVESDQINSEVATAELITQDVIEVAAEETVTSSTLEVEAEQSDSVEDRELMSVDARAAIEIETESFDGIDVSSFDQNASIPVAEMMMEQDILMPEAVLGIEGLSESELGTQSVSPNTDSMIDIEDLEPLVSEQPKVSERAEENDLVDNERSDTAQLDVESSELELEAAFAAEQAKLQEVAAETVVEEIIVEEVQTDPEPEDPVKAAARRIMGKHTGPRPSEKIALENKKPVLPTQRKDGTGKAKRVRAADRVAPAVRKPRFEAAKVPAPKAAVPDAKAQKATQLKERPVAHKPLLTEAQERSQFSDASELLIMHVKSKNPEGFAGSTLLHIALACGMQVGEMQVFHRFNQMSSGAKIQFSMMSSVNPGTFDIDNIDDLYVPGVSFIMALPAPGISQECFTMMLETAKVIVKNLNGELRDENRSVMTPQTIEHYRQRIQDFERRRQIADKAVRH